MKALKTYNHQSIETATIPVLSYSDFYAEVIEICISENIHCVSYFGYFLENEIHFICCIADDTDHSILLLSWQCPKTGVSVNSITEKIHSFYIFEREIHENFGIEFKKHPWLKPLRYAWNRHNHSKYIADYPFFEIDSEELHEVGVGPIHAGIIEPGHFRFLCNGERIIHLEIQHGFQHRGIEHLFLKKTKLNQRIALAESIAGDTATGHSSAFAWLWESLCNVQTSENTSWQRTAAMEIERIAIHTGDLAAICTDVAYQLGNSVLGRLRTPMVNFMQEWCGNRLGKSLVRPFGTFYDFTPELHDSLLDIINAYEHDYFEIWDRMKSLPSLLSRLEKTGVVTHEQVAEIGTVGMAARMSTLKRDIRWSHPYGLFKMIGHEPVLKRHGDVYSRTQLRNEEIRQSLNYLKTFLENIPPRDKTEKPERIPQPSKFAISLTEGWRGEICHCAITDSKGDLIAYKIKDPSMHNWLALALAVRNNEISDFPINNKSFNLSYCGFDL